jgi:hypothetical protein
MKLIHRLLSMSFLWLMIATFIFVLGWSGHYIKTCLDDKAKMSQLAIKGAPTNVQGAAIEADPHINAENSQSCAKSNSTSSTWSRLNIAVLVVGAVFGYRILQEVVLRLPIPVGGRIGFALAIIVAALFGSEASWRNRILCKSTSPVDRFLQRSELIRRLYMYHPMLRGELAKLRDNKV